MGLCSMPGGWSMMLPGTLLTLAVWALLIWAGVRIYRSSTSRA